MHCSSLKNPVYSTYQLVHIPV